MQRPVARQTEWAYRGLLALAGLGILVLALSHGFLQRASRIPTRAEAAEVTVPPGMPAAIEHPDPASWQVFQAGLHATPDPSGHALSTRYRLAGTFLVPGGEAGQSPIRKAIVDEPAENRQKLVNEGDDLEPSVRVVRIEPERVVLDAAGETVILGLNLRLGAGSGAPGPATSTGGEGTASGSLDSTPYGDRIADQRWVLHRDALLQYYEDLKDDPERIALLYETFKPVVEEGRVAGYRLGIEGEEEFLKAMDLQENDIVRTVNSMDMVSQSRAEFFLREFVQGRMSAVVLEVERDNVRTKKIYEIR
jgi:type II secretory pathway component PulC